MDKRKLEAEIAVAFILDDNYKDLTEEELFTSVFHIVRLRADFHIKAFGEIMASSLILSGSYADHAIRTLQENLLLAWRLEVRHEQFFHSGDKSTAKLYISLVRSLNDHQLDLLINWQNMCVEEAVRDVMGYEPATERITVLYWLEGVRKERQKMTPKRK